MDYWGVRWKKPPSSLYWDIVENLIKEPTLDAPEAYPWPDPHDPSRFSGLRDHAKELYENSEYAVVMDAMGFGVFGQAAHQLRGFQNFLMNLLLAPKFAEALLDRVADFHATPWSHILDEVGEYIHVAMVLDDVATQNGPMMALDIYRKLIKPAHRKLWGLIKKKTRAALFLHSCGSVRQLIPDSLDLGVSILNPIQVSAADMDPRQLKAECGKDLVFWGGGSGGDLLRSLRDGSPEKA